MFDINSISNGLERGEDGIWRALESETVSYPSMGHGSCYSVEENSFWFKHRNNVITTAVHNYPPPNKGPIFDIGGGNGFVSQGLSQSGFEVVLVEPGEEGAVNALSRGIQDVVCATTTSAEFQNHSLPAIGLFDVIEHIESDVKFLQSIKLLMVPRGKLYATIPAYQFLWSGEDEHAGHYRRYTRASICSALEKAGFEVLFSTYFFSLLPLGIFLSRTIPYRLGLRRKIKNAEKVKQDHSISSPFAGKVLDRLFSFEIDRLKSNTSIPFGGSCLIIAESS